MRRLRTASIVEFCGGGMSQRPSGYQRQVDDVYETPAYVTHAVIPYLRRHALRVWDPANGPASKIAQALNEAGFNAIATRDNFLARTSLPDPRIDAICSNPPYGAGGRPAHQFIAHAIGLVPVVVMLLRIDFRFRENPNVSFPRTAKPSPTRSCCSIALFGLSAKARRDLLRIIVGVCGTSDITDHRQFLTRGGHERTTYE